MFIITKAIVKFLVLIFSLFIKVKKNNWLISLEGGGGSKCAENAYAFAKYILSKKNISLKVISQTNIKEFKKILVKPFSIKYIIALITSRILIIESDMHNDIPAYRQHGTVKINLFHGLALKKIYYSSKYIGNIFEKKLINNIRKFFVGFCYPSEYNLIVTSNIYHKKRYKIAFRNPNVEILGQPRNDILLKSNKKIIKKKIFQKLRIDNNFKVITYLPTFRDSQIEVNNNCHLYENTDFQKFLKKNNYIFLRKNHFFYEDNFKLLKNKKKNKTNANYYQIKNEFLTQELLKISDCLITDYSGIYFDFLLLEKPIVFYCYDLQRYQRVDREFDFNYSNSQITPGLKVDSINDLKKAITISLRNKKTGCINIKKSKKIFHKYTDNNSCKRLYEYIEKKFSTS
jgi:CDP-glycerol glycerophosphotransferase